MGHAADAKNHQKNVMFDIMNETLPMDSYAWEQVAAKYNERSS